MKTRKKKSTDAETLDRMFDEGSDEIDDYIDWDGPSVDPLLETRRVNVDFPEWMIGRLDREAKRRGVARQALIKMWLAERLDSRAQN